ncbi:unnamed protein product [Parascedosporium putredinis]|uniref:TPR repeat-containing protein n=1 Tax=Parascedosporium putredinis TaxID=1442378 RepID=A0A9P1M9C8_9PEZI|nr:unnamed protein product [Parascedosporium putredinis]CAI7991697.1 unnamed protein product [Parascedosporium putredinis]
MASGASTHQELLQEVSKGAYISVLTSPAAKTAIAQCVASLEAAAEEVRGDGPGATQESGLDEWRSRVAVGLAAFNAFLQFNVTGPVLEGAARVEAVFSGAGGGGAGASLEDLRKRCLKALEVDGVSPLLTQPTLGPGSSYNKSSQWSDVPALISRVHDAMDAVKGEVVGGGEGGGDSAATTSTGVSEPWSTEEKIRCLLELANYDIMLGRDEKARENITKATELSRFEYALTGALGKKTKYQENSTSQLVIVARSAGSEITPPEKPMPIPGALPLNDDTLLERIAFEGSKENGVRDAASLSQGLKGMDIDDQPALTTLDQIILLTEATLRDAFSPLDALTSEEILPYAERVLQDKSTNWQVYTQALIVRSRVEVHRSRTVERGVLQMQAQGGDGTIPAIAVSTPHDEAAPVEDKPTSFFRAPEAVDSAPAQDRLRYIHAISTPPRWHLESELAYGWTGVGALVSALEIFKRLRLWAEVALCLASAAAYAEDDENGRGSGGEEKARAIVRWRLFNKTGRPASESLDADDESLDADPTQLKPADFQGPERDPPRPTPPPPRGALPAKKDFAAARDAYKKAVYVNRLSSEMWSRLGDIHLRLGEMEDAVQAFSKAISSANDVVGGEDARTWSNLGSALWTLYLDAIETLKKGPSPSAAAAAAARAPKPPSSTTSKPTTRTKTTPRRPRRPRRRRPLNQALQAYKRGANLARENWRIWDNTETAVDDAVLRLLLTETVLAKEKREPAGASPTGVYELPRGTEERAVVDLLERDVMPLITARSELWELVARERAWKRDYAGAVEASERAWRAAIGMSASSASSLAPATPWLVVVKRTDELVSVLENYGPEVEAIGDKWKGKARSAVRSVMSKGKARWEGGEGWSTLESLMEELKR